MAKKVLTKTYAQLRGFSTDSKYVRPAQVADLAVNINRLSDGTMAPRRGYHIRADEIGGYGCAIYEDIPNNQTFPVTISKDGNLYKILEGDLTISFTGSSANEYITYEIYVDQTNTSDTAECDFNPYGVVLDTALVTDCINFRLKKVTEYTGESIGTGSDTYSGTLSNFPIAPGSLVMTDGTYTIYDDSNGGFTGDIGGGTNTINYTTGAYAVNFSASTGAVTASYFTPLTEVLDICLGKGYNDTTPYLITDLLAALNAVSGITATSTGNTDQPAAFLDLIEETNIANGLSDTLTYNYAVELNRTLDKSLPGMTLNLADDDFQMPTITSYRELLFIGSKYDDVQKFDGQTVYTAGVPKPERPGLTSTAAGNVDIGEHFYYATYEQVDNQGNIVEGVLSDGLSVTLASASEVTIAIDSLVDGSGYNTNCAIVDGTQTGVSTISVDDGSGNTHSMRAGDTAYFLENPAATVNGIQNNVNTITVNAGHTIFEGNKVYFDDSNNNEIRIRNVTATTSTSITIDGGQVSVADATEISTYRERKILSVTVSTISLDIPDNPEKSITVSVKDNAIISNNLRINVYRTNSEQYSDSIGTGAATYTGTLSNFPISPGSLSMSDGTLNVFDNGNGVLVGDTAAGGNSINYTKGEYTVTFSAVTGAVTATYGAPTAATPQLLAAIPNDAYTDTSTYVDDTPDSELNLQLDYDFPDRLHNPPPSECGIVYAYKNLMIYTGDQNNDDYVWFSDPDDPEYVSEAFNNFIVPSNDDDVTGVGAAGSSLIIFKNRSIYSVSGELATSQFDVNPVGTGSNIGCVSHHSIQSVGGLLYFLHTNGVFSISENQFFPTDDFGNPVPISSIIDTRFREEPFEFDKKLVFERSTAINYTKDNQYLLFIPAEEKTGDKASNENERVFCFDYQKKNWFEWTRINAAGDWYIKNDDLHWFSRGYKNSMTISRLYKQNRTYTLIDQVDHVTPIRVTWQSSWEDLGQPRVRKKFARCALLFDDLRAQFLQNIPTLCFTAFKDWIEDRPKTRANLMQKIESTEWSDSQWSYLDWSGYQDTFIVVNMMNSSVAKCVKIQLQLNKINSTFKLQGFQHEASVDFRSTFVR